VQHRGKSSVRLDAILSGEGAIPVSMAADGMEVKPSRVYLAPHDRHLVLQDGNMRVLGGPRENLARPSIDMLFRSAAVDFGPRVIGVLLSGGSGDGEQGLASVQRCGGLTIVQDPKDAEDPDLPNHALEPAPDYVIKASGLAALLSSLVESKHEAARPVPRDLEIEAHAAFAALTDPSAVSSYGEASHITCPECKGPLWRASVADRDHFRCDVGHSFTMPALLRGQAIEVERALWIAYRTLLERARTVERLIETAKQQGRPSSSNTYEERLREMREHAASIHGVLGAIQTRELGHEAETVLLKA